jgi:DNA-binding SARP family transcriptional activator
MRSRTERSVSPKGTSALKVFLLGPLRVAFRDRILERWPSRKGKFLFAYLAMNHSKIVSRDTLMEMFWPRSAPRSARNCLNVTIHGLRQHLQAVAGEVALILYENEGYLINPELDFWLDVDEFKRAWSEGRTREQQSRIKDALARYSMAARLYIGDLMEESPYEDWLDLEREHLKEVYLGILDRMSHHYSLDGDPYSAISLCERMLEKDACQEEVHRRLMLCYFKLGFRDKALKQYQRCVLCLRQELDVEPTSDTMRLYEKIRTADVSSDLARTR